MNALKSYNFLLMPLLSLTGLIILPGLNGGYAGDDVFMSYVKGKMIHLNQDFLQFFKSQVIDGWMLGEGRVFPLSFLINFLFYFNYNYTTYFLFMIFLNLACAFSFARLVFTLTHSRSASVIFLCMLPLTIQLKYHHFEPVLTQGGLIQYLFLSLVWSLHHFYKYLGNNRIKHFIFSILLYTACSLIYDISYVFFVFPIYIALFFIGQRRITTYLRSMVFLLISFVLIALSLYLRSIKAIGIATGGGGHTKYKLNFDFEKIYKTLENSFFSAMPLNYFKHNPDKIEWGNFPNSISFFILGTILLIGYFYIVHNYFPNSKLAKNKTIHLLGFALLFSIVPNAPIALSPIYQSDIVPGRGYLPVYFSYYGISLLFTLLILRLPIVLKRSFFAISFLSILTATIFMVNYHANQRAVATHNLLRHYPRTILEEALRSPLLDLLPTGTTLISETFNVPEMVAIPGFYNLYGKGKIRFTLGKQDFFYGGHLPKDWSGKDIKISEDKKLYYQYYESYAKNSGYYLTGPIQLLNIGSADINKVAGKNFYLFVQNPKGKNSSLHISGRFLDSNGQTVIDPLKNNDIVIIKIYEGSQWTLYSIYPIDKNQKLQIDFKSIQIHLKEKTLPK